ncbi:MAG: hypothetical protein U0Z17_08295 [Bacteroidales bacterium]
MLLRLLGGPAVVEDYFRKYKFSDISIKINEDQQQADWQAQFSNWTIFCISQPGALQVLLQYRKTALRKSH